MFVCSWKKSRSLFYSAGGYLCCFRGDGGRISGKGGIHEQGHDDADGGKGGEDEFHGWLAGRWLTASEKKREAAAHNTAVLALSWAMLVRS